MIPPSYYRFLCPTALLLRALRHSTRRIWAYDGRRCLYVAVCGHGVLLFTGGPVVEIAIRLGETMVPYDWLDESSFLRIYHDYSSCGIDVNAVSEFQSSRAV